MFFSCYTEILSSLCSGPFLLESGSFLVLARMLIDTQHSKGKGKPAEFSIHFLRAWALGGFLSPFINLGLFRSKIFVPLSKKASLSSQGDFHVTSLDRKKAGKALGQHQCLGVK